MDLKTVTKADILPGDALYKLSRSSIDILFWLRDKGTLSCSEIAEKTKRRLDAVSHNLSILGELGLITRVRDGRVIRNSLTRDFIIFDLVTGTLLRPSEKKVRAWSKKLKKNSK